MAETKNKPKPPAAGETKTATTPPDETKAAAPADETKEFTGENPDFKLAQERISELEAELKESNENYESFREEAMKTVKLAQERISELEEGGATGGLPYVKDKDPKKAFLEACVQTGPDQDWLYSERMSFSMDETYNADTIRERAEHVLKRAFIPALLGGLDKKLGVPTCSTLPPFSHGNRLVVTVAVIRG